MLGCSVNTPLPWPLPADTAVNIAVGQVTSENMVRMECKLKIPCLDTGDVFI